MANIDAELAFLRDANESSGLISREAITNALEIINAERAYPPKMLEATSNGEYDAGAGKAYTKVKVDVPGGGIKFDGFIAPFTVRENGKVYAKDYSDKDLWINEFEVDVPSYLDEDIKPVTIQSNGEYEPEENCKYGVVTVNIPDAKHPGDLVTASMYFFDPNNPNDATYIFIDKDEQILFGDSAREFLDRFPKFKEIDGYVHDDWNPNPDSIVSDQWYIPRWIPKPFNYSSEQKPIDYDVFLYIVRHMVLNCFFNLEDNISVNIDGETVALSVYCESFKDANGQQVHYGFKMSAYDKNASIDQFVLNVLNSSWSFKNWGSINDVSGRGVWTDGTDIFFTSKYIYDRINHVWANVTWQFIPEYFNNKRNVWTDGIDTYYSYTLGNDSYQYVLDKLNMTWNAKRWKVQPEINGYYIWTDGTDIFYSYGNENWMFDTQTNKWVSVTWTGLPINLQPGNIWTDGINTYFSYNIYQYVLDKPNMTWNVKTWTGLSNFYGQYVWKDGNHVYYSKKDSSDNYTYELDIANSEWVFKTWYGLSANDYFYGNDVWTDGTDIYYSYSDAQYKLNRNTDTWEAVTWTKYNGDSYKPYGVYIWTDGVNIYADRYYKLNPTTLIWELVNWSPTLPEPYTGYAAHYIWSDGTNTYFSYKNTQYVLDSANATWLTKAWYKDDSYIDDIKGEYIWTDGAHIYYSNAYLSDQKHYVLDVATSTWLFKTWNGISSGISFRGEYIWTDGTDIYFSNYRTNLVLDRSTDTWNTMQWGGIEYTDTLYGYNIWSDGTDIYYSYEKQQLVLDKMNNTWNAIAWHGTGDINGSNVWSDGTDIYYSSNDHTYKKPLFCNRDTSDITSETPVSHGNYYWWGCSLARALVNGDRSMLVRQSDIDIYDNANWDIDHFVPASIKTDALTVAYYITHPKRVDTANTCRYKSVPRKNLSIVQGPNTHAPVVNPTGNPQEQGWYLYDSSNKTFNLTTDTTVDPDKTYYYVRSSYTVSVDAPVISDQFIWDDETVAYKRIGTGKQSTGWGDYNLNLRHSPILYITQENGQYKAYKKVNGNFIEYTIDDHLKYVRSHAWTSVDGYLAYRTMLGVRDKIYDTEHLEGYEDIRMEDVYFMGAAGNVRSCIYLYDKVNKIYYSFDAKKTDDEESYNATIRHSIDTEPSYISNVDAHIADRTYRPMFETHSYANGGKHGYLTEYDIWPDERVWIYATGGFFEKEQSYFPDPETGDVYSVDFAYNLIDCEDYTNYYFFNYYDVINGFNTCPPAYHFVYSNGAYVLTRVDTQYTGYTSETVEYQVENVCEKVTDKFVVDDIRGDNYINRNVYAPPYYADQARVNYEMNNFNNIINTPLIESLEIIRTVESGNRNDKGIINDINGVYSPLCTYFSNLRNTAQNLYADEETIRLFDKRDADNASNPGLYPLYDYTQASGIWQYCHDLFSRDYSLIGPHNSYTANGNPETYDYLYFFL